MPAFLRARLGIRRTFQRVEVFPEMSVRDHMIVAERARRGDGALWKDLLNMAKPKPDELAHVDEVLELVGLTEMADVPVAALSLGHCRLVELGRALCGEPRLLMADEPSSGLDMSETAALAAVLRGVQRDRGMAVLLVEHDMEMVRTAVGPGGGARRGGDHRPGDLRGGRGGPRGPSRLSGSVGMTDPILELDNVSASYSTYRALFGVSIVVPDNGIVALVGSNGAGKSTVGPRGVGSRGRRAAGRSVSPART